MQSLAGELPYAARVDIKKKKSSPARGLGLRRGRTGTYGVLPCAPGHPEEKAVPPGNTGHVGLPGAASGVVPGAGSRWHRARLPAWVRWGSGFWVPGQQGCRPGALSPSPGQPPTSGGLALLCGSGWGSIPATLANPVGSGAAGRGPRSPPTDFPAPSPPQPQGVCCRRSQGPRVRVLRAACVPALPHHLRWVPGLQHLPVSAARSREAHQPPRTLGREAGQRCWETGARSCGGLAEAPSQRVAGTV